MAYHGLLKFNFPSWRPFTCPQALLPILFADVNPTDLATKGATKTRVSCFCQQISFPGLSHYPVSCNPIHPHLHGDFPMSPTGQSHFLLWIASQLCFYAMVFLTVKLALPLQQKGSSLLSEAALKRSCLGQLSVPVRFMMVPVILAISYSSLLSSFASYALWEIFPCFFP